MQQLISAEARPGVGGLLAGDTWSVEERSTDDLARQYHRDLANPFAGEIETQIGAEKAEPPWLDTVFVTARRRG
jgi:hypothetical protein